MKRKTLLILAAGIMISIISSVRGVTIDTGGRGEVNEIGFTVDFGSVSFVSDLSAGGLRFNPVTIGGTQITTDNLIVPTDSRLSFDWSVNDQSMYFEQSFYQILGLDPVAISFHRGEGMGTAEGSIARQLDPGAYQLQIRTAFEDFNIGMYELEIDNLELSPIPQIPDSPLGLFGIASILAILGIHRRLSNRGN